MLRQKTRSEWLQLMDRNVMYFYNLIKERRRRNQILSLKNQNDELTRNEEEIKAELTNHFQKMMCAQQDDEFDIDENILKEGRVLNEVQKKDLMKEFTDNEIKEALLEIDDSKTPGADGYTSCFFKKSWHIVRPQERGL